MLSFTYYITYTVIKSWGSEATPSATLSSKISYKIGHLVKSSRNQTNFCQLWWGWKAMLIMEDLLNERVTKPDASDHHDFTIKYRVTELVTDFQSRQLKFQCGNKYVAELARHPPFPSFDTKVWIILVTSFVPRFLTFLLYIKSVFSKKARTTKL